LARFAINDDEMAAMAGLGYLARALYISLRARMDFATGLVGQRPKISRQAIAEDLYVEPGQGVSDSGSPSVAAIRWALDKLRRAGLIEVVPADRQLIFKLVLADAGQVRAKEVQPIYSRGTADQAQPTESEEDQELTQQAQPKYSRGTAEEVQPASGIWYQENQTEDVTESVGNARAGARQPAPASQAAGQPIPPNFAHDPSHAALAMNLRLNLQAELEQFRDHYTATGLLCADWRAKFRTWLRNSAKRDDHRMDRPRTGTPAQTRLQQQADTIAALTGRNRQPAEKEVANGRTFDHEPN
jgi:hypothetical protein